MIRKYTLSELFPGLSDKSAYYVRTLEAIEGPERDLPFRQTFYAMIWFTQGGGFLVIDFNEYKIRPGRMFLINPEMIINWSFFGNCKGYTLMFSNTLATQLNIDFSKHYIDVGKHSSPLLRFVFEELIRVYNREHTLNAITISIQYLYSLVEEKIHIDLPPQESDIFRQFKSLIHTQKDRIWTIQEYANALDVSKTALDAICMEIKGISAKQYLLDSVITEAKRLLIYSNANINDISFQTGCDDPSYFARIFKKKTTLTPVQFREMYCKRRIDKQLNLYDNKKNQQLFPKLGIL